MVYERKIISTGTSKIEHSAALICSNSYVYHGEKIDFYAFDIISMMYCDFARLGGILVAGLGGKHDFR